MLCVRFVGKVLGRDLRAMHDYRNAWGAERSHYFILVDMSGIQDVDSDARKAMTEERAQVDRRQTSLYYGASFTIRTIAQMMFRSLKLLRPNIEYTERHFVATEADARAFIEKRRKERAKAV